MSAIERFRLLRAGITEKPTCGNCVFSTWIGTRFDEHYECRRNPPKQHREDPMAFWPTVPEKGFCGEFTEWADDEANEGEVE